MIKVFPMVANAMLLKHPTAGPLKAEGSDWPEDGYTFRMLSDEAITEDGAKAWKAPPPEPEKASGPSTATAPGARDIREPPAGIVKETDK